MNVSDDDPHGSMSVVTDDTIHGKRPSPATIRPPSINPRKTFETSSTLLAARGIPTLTITPAVSRPSVRTRSPILEGLLARGEITPAVFEQLQNIDISSTKTLSPQPSQQPVVVTEAPIHDQWDVRTAPLPPSNQIVAEFLDNGSLSAAAYQRMAQHDPNAPLGRSESSLTMSHPQAGNEDRYNAATKETKWEAEEAITLEWRNLTYTIQRSRRTAKERILKDLSGEARPGEVVALLGGSGAGKSTLLNVLAGRVTSGEISGDIRCNNHRRDRSSWKRSVGYVEQDDLMDESLTVLELLTYVALLKLPDDMPLSCKHQRVDEVINQMRLGDCKDTVIGDSVKRGISGGERKRVHIGMELMTSPMCMFFDEPTTGLDSFNAYHVIDTIREAADTGGRTMIMAIHQPRKEILEKFDRIILLSKGQLTFTGNVEDAITYFDTVGYPVPALTNPGDHFLDVSTPDSSTEGRRLSSDGRIEKLANHWRLNFNSKTFPPFTTKPLPVVNRKKHNRGLGGSLVRYAKRWSILAERNLLSIQRDKQTTYIIIVQTVLVIFLFGWLFWQLGLDQKSINNRLGVLFFLGLERFLTGLFRIVRILPSQRPLIVRERSKSMYTASEIYFSKLTTDIITIFIQHIVTLTALYFMVGFQVVARKYGIFIGIGSVLAITGHSLGYLISAVAPSVEVGLVIATMLSSVYGMFAGNLIIPSDVPLWLRWITYSDPLYYSFSGWSQNEFKGLVFSCEDDRCFPNGDAVLSFQDIQEVPIQGSYGVLLGLWMMYTFLGYVAIRYSTRAKRVKTFM
ncbi:hypothetical protein SeMB42_g07140 [Synchytrium endobioticum]|uniref:ABC transporter domain-containing protein n=1 Tax=Synchytrium endobioticum TaxID=286115 RepID=A0A507CE80_9FUNG|nr:hypothetical protein SeMB42_g07140 [Synchytrium endobioticum]TPX37764.1 hypothetical protein SeLEV6574_g07881 [Synchytrium endobioticum]